MGAMRHDKEFADILLETIDKQLDDRDDQIKLSLISNFSSQKVKDYMEQLYTEADENAKELTLRALNFGKGDVNESLTLIILNDYKAIESFTSKKINLGFTLISIYDRTQNNKILTQFKNDWSKIEDHDYSGLITIFGNSHSDDFYSYYLKAAKSENHVNILALAEILGRKNDSGSQKLIRVMLESSDVDTKRVGYQIIMQRNDYKSFKTEISNCLSSNEFKNICKKYENTDL